MSDREDEAPEDEVPEKEEEEKKAEKTQSKRSKLKGMLKESLLKGKLSLEHSLGLGHKPNVIPPAEADIHGDHRLVEIGWHPVGGLAGRWFAEQTGLGREITKAIKKYPDPTQHWAVLVEGYVHQLWMDENLHVIYINERVVREEWHTFEVGKTRFNDEALRQTGEMVIHNMRQARPAYNLITNNCQTFAVAMLDAIQIGAHQKFATSFAVYQAATGKGAIKDLFVDKHPEEQSQAQEVVAVEDGDGDGDGGAAEGKQKLKRQDTLQHAQQVMDENTTKLDTHAALH